MLPIVLRRKEGSMKKRIIVLASGGGGTMKFLHRYSQIADAPYEIKSIIADRDCGAVDYGNANGMMTKVIKPWRSRIPEVVEDIRSINPDIVITNISKILPEEVFTCCKATFINLHYSLLPSFGGVIGFKTVEMAKEKQSRIIGATCHLVTAELDGGPILAQGAMPVDWSEEIESIEKNVFRIACKSILVAIMNVCDIKNNMASSDGFMYSPSLNFDDKLLNESFWASTL